MKKKLLTLGSLVAITAPVAAVVACGTNTKTTIKKVMDGTKIENGEVKSLFDKTNFDKPYYVGNDANWKDIQSKIKVVTSNTVSTKDKSIINEVIQTDDGEGFNVRGAMYKFGTKSDILFSSNGIVHPQKLQEHKDADKYEYQSNLLPFTLAEGGNVNMELIVKDGKILNLPANNINKWDPKYFKPTEWFDGVSQDGFIAKYNESRPVVYVDQNNVPHVKIESMWKNNFQLKLSIDDKKINATERRGNRTFDFIENKDKFTKDPAVSNYNNDSECMKLELPKDLDGLSDKNLLVYITPFNSEVKDLDLSTVNAYEVEATDTNGITTTNGLLGTSIEQAPFKGEVTKKITDAKYKTKPGTALVITKKDYAELKVGQKVNANYTFANDNFKDIKNAKYAFSLISYSGTVWGSDKAFKANNLNPLRMNPGGLEAPDDKLLYGGNYMIRDNKIISHAPWQEISGASNSARTVFVIDEKRKMFGTLTFTKNSYLKLGHVNSVSVYLKGLGITQAVHGDGGGSSESFLGEASKGMKQFAKSVDLIGERSLTSSFVMGGSDE